MARDPKLVAKEYKQIQGRFKELFSEKEYGLRKYTLAWIHAKIGDEFHKAPKTIKTILTKPISESKDKPCDPPIVPDSFNKKA